MAALTASVHLPYMGLATKIEVPAIGADTFYAGALVYADATNGKAQVGSLAAGDFFIGICAKKTVTTAADDLVPIYVNGVVGFPISGTTSADIGKLTVIDASAITDNPADVKCSADITDAANDICLGQICSVLDGYAYTDLGRHFPKFDTDHYYVSAR